MQACIGVPNIHTPSSLAGRSSDVCRVRACPTITGLVGAHQENRDGRLKYPLFAVVFGKAPRIDPSFYC